LNTAINLLNILGSPVSLSKAIMNLVTNAAEATKDGGEIAITSLRIATSNTPFGGPKGSAKVSMFR
jgi:signal transduction histidine kinase